MRKSSRLSVQNMDNMLCDRISDLPEDIMNNILSRVPLRDAARTRILSTKWKHHWTRTESLKIGKYFSCEFLPCGLKDEMRLSAFVSKVMDILLSHRGPVRKFHFYIPDFFDTPFSDDINLLILCVSRFGVQDLTLQYGGFRCDPVHQFPSSVFRCVELKHLSLKFAYNATMKMELPSHDFRKLSSLVSLELCGEDIPGDEFTGIISNCPQIERLSLELETIYEPVVISAPKLKLLSVAYCRFIDFKLKNTPNISTLSLRKVESTEENGEENIVEFFSAIPKVESIDLEGFVLEWNRQNVPERLPVLLENHSSLTVRGLILYSPLQIRSMFCLIRSSPKLQTLDISLWPYEGEPGATNNYLKSQLHEAENLASLKTVKITDVTGGELVIAFIEIVLSRCPNLEVLYLRNGCRTRLSTDAECKMMATINQFRKASTQAKIIYSKLPN